MREMKAKFCDGSKGKSTACGGNQEGPDKRRVALSGIPAPSPNSITYLLKKYLLNIS
jgi:hypothetical protein